MKKIYINSALKTIDDALCEQFEKHTCSDIEESSIVVVSKKNTKPENIRSLTGGGKRKVILLADMSDTDLIKAARDANAEIFYSPVKIPELSKKISEMLDIEQPGPDTGKQQEVMKNKGQPEKKTQDTPKPAKPADAYTEKDLTDLMQQIKSRMTGSGELEQLRKENQELKEKVKRYETFISVLADIFNTTVN